MDVLAEVLAVSGVKGTLGARIDAGEAWGWWAERAPGAAFHAVTSGTAWLAVPGRAAIQLLPGDVVLLPRGTEHTLASDPATLDATNRHAHSQYQQTSAGVVAIGTGLVRTHILCAHYEHDPAVTTQVLALLPELVHIRAAHTGGGLDDTVRLLARELADPQLATATILDSLVDILLIQVLRFWLASQPAGESERCWLRVLSDPVVGTAIARMHEDPARAWTTAALADEVSVSRATLARRFPAVLGETPAAYLTRWRMDLAARRLRDTDDTLESIAQSVGYTSVYAFSRAFSRARAEPPGRYRLSARAQQRLRAA